MAAEYVLKEGNEEVMLCERGIRTFETRYRFTLDLLAVPALRELTHLPVDRRPVPRGRPPRLGRSDVARGGGGGRGRDHRRGPQRARRGDLRRTAGDLNGGLRRVRRAGRGGSPRWPARSCRPSESQSAPDAHSGPGRRADWRVDRARREAPPRRGGRRVRRRACERAPRRRGRRARPRRRDDHRGAARAPRSSSARGRWVRCPRSLPRRSPRAARTRSSPTSARPSASSSPASPRTSGWGGSSAAIRSPEPRRAGVENARDDLFEGARWYLTPTERSSGVHYDRLQRARRRPGRAPAGDRR